MALYTYSTPNANAGQLREEVAAAGLPVDFVTATAATADVYTTRDLTGPEVTTLNGVVAAHVPGSYQSSPGEGEKVKVGADDTTAGYLAGKLVAGTAGVSLTPSAPGDQTLAVNLLVDDTDTLDLHLSGGFLYGLTRHQMSLTSDAGGLKLAGDIATPGGGMLYGTDAGGARGWYAQPAGGGGGGELTDGDKVDITVSGGGTIWTIDPGAVTYAKIQDVAEYRLLGRGSPAGPPWEVSLGYGLSMQATALRVVLGYGAVVKAATEAVGTTSFITHSDPALTLPAGTYEIWYEASLVCLPTGATSAIVLQLYNDTDAAAVPDTQRQHGAQVNVNIAGTARASAFVDLTGNKTFRLQSRRTVNTAGTLQLVSDGNARTVIGYRRLG